MKPYKHKKIASKQKVLNDVTVDVPNDVISDLPDEVMNDVPYGVTANQRHQHYYQMKTLTHHRYDEE